MGVFPCPRCGQPIAVDDDTRPSHALCVNCGEQTPIPKPDSATVALQQSSENSADALATPADEECIPTVAGEPDGPRPLPLLPPNVLTPPQAGDELGRLGNYRVLKLLGAGGMGVVLQAEDIELHRLVALKILRPELSEQPRFRERFLREARMTAAIKSDHIVTIHQVGQDRDVPFFAMEYLEGESLRTRLHREKTLPITEVVRIGRELSEGLAAAHSRGLIHRDIKPGNIWLESRKPSTGVARAKILDFGLAHHTESNVHLTRTGTIVG